MEPCLSIRGLAKSYVPGKPVLQHIDLDIHAGEVVAIIGPSGTGKSTLIRCINRLVQPSAGEIRFEGLDLAQVRGASLRHARRQIGMVFQDPLTSLNPLYKIGDQLTETILTHLPVSATEARQRALALLTEVGIPSPERRIDSYPHEFSGGMRQRVVLALALCAEPELVIADEPTTALDVSVQAQIIALLKKLCRERGTAVMLVTHDMGVIAETADRVAVMYAGRIVEIGPVREVVQNPKHPYAQGLMGAIPTLEGGRDKLVQIEGSMPQLKNIPAGCAFNPRCPHAFARCFVEKPDLVPVDHSRVACYLYDDKRAENAA